MELELEYSTILYSSIFLSLVILLLFAFKLLFGPQKKLPPSPPSLPIIGHLHLIQRPTFSFFHTLSQTYGPIFSLRFGSRRIVVVSSSKAAKECLTKHDNVLADRPKLHFGKYIGYNWSILSSSPYGDHWRNLRRITVNEVSSSSGLSAFLSIRKDEGKRLLKRLWSDNEDKFVKVELKSVFEDLAFNNIVRMVTGKRYYDCDDGEFGGEAKEFKEVIKEIFVNGAVSHPGDFFPFMNWIGGTSYSKKLKNLGERFDRLLQKLIDEARGKKQGHSTVIDHFLSLQETDPHFYTDQVIKGLMMEIMLAGTEPVAVTLEWSLSYLLNNPNVLKTAKAEIDCLIGQEILIDESDVSKLPYLQSIIFETLRLSPASPLLLPHMASADCKIYDYDVPRGTIVLFNVWAIHRDPELWEDPSSFKPERFENGELNKIMPFGLGRRACAGASLAQRILGLTIGLLIQCFEWKKIGEKEIDMASGDGISMPKVVPLDAMYKAYPIIKKALNEAI